MRQGRPSRSTRCREIAVSELVRGDRSPQDIAHEHEDVLELEVRDGRETEVEDNISITGLSCRTRAKPNP